jgi:hypothetical protein
MVNRSMPKRSIMQWRSWVLGSAQVWSRVISSGSHRAIYLEPLYRSRNCGNRITQPALLVTATATGSYRPAFSLSLREACFEADRQSDTFTSLEIAPRKFQPTFRTASHSVFQTCNIPQMSALRFWTFCTAKLTSWVSHAAWPQIKMQEHKRQEWRKSNNPQQTAPCSVNYNSQCLQGRHLADVSQHLGAGDRLFPVCGSGRRPCKASAS